MGLCWIQCMKVKVKSLSRVRLFATPWTVAYQVLPSMGFPRQECWSGLPFPSPGDLPDPGIESGSPALQADALPSEPPGKPIPKKGNAKERSNYCTIALILVASLVAQMVKCLPAMQETRVRFLGQEDPLEKEMAIHSSTLAWKIPWMEEPDRLQSMGSQRVRHD